MLDHLLFKFSQTGNIKPGETVRISCAPDRPIKLAGTVAMGHRLVIGMLKVGNLYLYDLGEYKEDRVQVSTQDSYQALVIIDGPIVQPSQLIAFEIHNPSFEAVDYEARVRGLFAKV
jgi:hypothetical protein